MCLFTIEFLMIILLTYIAYSKCELYKCVSCVYFNKEKINLTSHLTTPTPNLPLTGSETKTRRPEAHSAGEHGSHSQQTEAEY